ncbi:hypothetical protein ALC57_15405, partial [Trachymyrmex cornetzi]
RTINSPMYLEFLENNLPAYLENVPLAVRLNLWYQQDGAPAHYARIIRMFLNQRFPNRWIGRGGPVLWPPRSPDLNSLDFFLTDIREWYVIEPILASLEEFQERDSGWALSRILNLTVNVNKLNPMRPGCHFEIPREIMLKKAVVSVKSKDNVCFAWSVVAALYPAKSNVDRKSPEKKYVKKNNFFIYRCLHYFGSSQKLKTHEVDCQKMNDYAIRLPSENDKWLQFGNHCNRE